ncbi:MAG: Glutathione import ATP-binding protein GsiA [Chlamydiae bacterium]|nr:Glutathione import ATP-binding protein GsiA [Chlamydiota bacterium]
MNKPELFKVEGLKVYFPILAGLFRSQVGEIKAVDGIDFTLFEGDLLGLVGESGSGKSTTARASIRLIEPTAGKIHFNNQDVRSFNKKRLKEFRREIQIIFQDPYSSLNPRKSVRESIGEGVRFYKIVDESELTDYVAENLTKVGLTPDLMHRYPHEISGGQQQRICIGRALALKPKMIICDEAVSALDVSVQAQILNLLMELKETYGLTYLFISHDLSVVRYLCDRVVVMNRGKIVERGETEEIFKNPQDSYTQELIAAIPQL